MLVRPRALVVTQCAEQTGAACVWATHDLHMLPAKAARLPCCAPVQTPWLIEELLSKGVVVLLV